MTPRLLDFETIAAHAGMSVRVGDTHATIAPIAASTTFTGESIEDVHSALVPDAPGFAYGRNGNPTVVGLEGVLAQLEGTDDAVVFSSGMAAIHGSLLALDLEPGDTILSASALYGVTRALLGHLAGAGIETIYVDIFSLEAVRAALEETTVRALYFESIANPLLQVADVSQLSAMARERGVPVIVDNTFATPYLLRPLDHGADIVVHSATKYLAGHGDVTAGVVAANHSWISRIRAKRGILGAVLSPFDAWLTLRGVRTLPLRMERQCTSAGCIALWLREQPWIERVYYPGFTDNPFYALAHHLFNGRFGGMLAADVGGNEAQTLHLLNCLELITPGTSLGDVASLVLYPALSSHRSLTPPERLHAGIGEGLIRLSIGLESPRDLEADLQGAAERSGLLAASS